MPAFTLGTFGVWSALEFVLTHGFAFGSIGLVLVVAATVALAIFVPGSIALIRTAIGVVTGLLRALIGTEAGRALIVAVAVFWMGWAARAWLDESVEVRRELVAQERATREAQEAAAKARLQAAALDQANAAASRRAEAAEAEAADDAEQAADLSDQLAAADRRADKAAGGKRRACASGMTAADIDALARIGARRAKP